MGPTEIITVVGVGVPLLLSLIALIAEVTHWESGSKFVAVARKIWSYIPIGQTDPTKMGKGNPNK